MNAFEEIKKEWHAQMVVLNKLPWMQRLSSGNLEVSHYMGFLQETYHNAGMNPQLQAYATMFFQGRPREMVKMFYRHAISEIAHDLLALDDLEVLGVSRDLVIQSRPLPTTSAFLGHALYKIQFESALTYLGYLFHLEFLPTTSGHSYMDVLMKKGVPKEALTFIQEHSTVDVAHNKLMEAYIKEFVQTQADLDVVVESVCATAILHVQMLSGAFENGEKIFPQGARKVA